MRLAWYLLDCAIVNAFKYHEALAGRMKIAQNQREFREQLRDELIAGHCYRKQMGRPAAPSESLRYDNGKHLIIEHNERLSRVCAGSVCSTRTFYLCQRCAVHVCVRCFAAYHTQ